MASLRYIVPALAIVGSAAAATCSVDATTTIQNAGDATGLASCQTFSGSIAIATGTTDNINLSGIQEITGSLIAESARNLPGISSTTLDTIGDTFYLNGTTAISSLNFPRLTSVDKIDWSGLGQSLQQLTFTSEVSMASELSIQNTFLATLTGINLVTVSKVNLANNIFLTSVSMKLNNVTDELIIQSNGKNVTAEFPNLMFVNDAQINNVSTFSIPSLETVNNSIYFNSDYFTELSAPNLTSVGQALSINNCPQLTNISFPLLKSIGGAINVTHNDALKEITGFPSLASIGGALDYEGSFTNATLPSLQSVLGGFNIQSTANITDVCNHFNPLQGSNNVIQGQITCYPNVGTTTAGAASESGSGTQPSHTNAAHSVTIPAATGLLGVVAAIFGLL